MFTALSHKLQLAASRASDIGSVRQNWHTKFGAYKDADIKVH
jgi:hypothetical protein